MVKAQRKKSAKKSPYLKRKSALSRDDIYEIEKIPPPLIGRWNPDRAATIAKLDATLTNVTIGQAFIIPVKEKNMVAKYLKEGYPTDKFVYQRIHGNPDKLRVYRFSHTNKK